MNASLPPKPHEATPLSGPPPADSRVVEMADHFQEAAWSLIGVALLVLAAAFYAIPSWKNTLIGPLGNQEVMREPALGQLWTYLFLPETLIKKWGQPDLAQLEGSAKKDGANSSTAASPETAGNVPPPSNAPRSDRGLSGSPNAMPGNTAGDSTEMDIPNKPWVISDRFPLFAMALGILAAAWGSGQLLLRLLGLGTVLRGWEQWILSTMAGLSLISVWSLLVGLAGKLQTPLIFILPGCVAFGLAVLLHFLRPKHSQNVAEEAPMQPARLGGPAWWCWGLGFGLICTSLLFGAVLPPTDFDVREYHLQAPREWYEQGSIGFMPHNIYANMPMHAESLCLPAMSVMKDSWYGALAGKLVMALFTPLAALLLFTAGRRYFNANVAMNASLLYLGTPQIVLLSVAGYVEHVMAAYFAAAAYSLARWSEGRGDQTSTSPEQKNAGLGWVMLSGWFVGSIVACKYTALVFFLTPFVIWMGSTIRSRGYRPLCVFLLFAAMAPAGWLLKNTAYTGNPVYPLLEGKIGTALHDADQIQRFTREHRPRTLTFVQLESDFTRCLLLADWVNPFVLPLALLALLSKRWRTALGICVGYLVFYYVEWWFLTHRLPRFVDPAHPCMVLLAALGTESFSGPLWRWFARLCVALSLVVTWGYAASESFSPSSYFAPLNDLRNDARFSNGWQVWLNAQKLQPDERIMMIAEGNVFPVNHPLIYATCWDHCPWETLTKGKSPREAWQALRDQKIKYVYTNWGELNRYRSPGNYGYSKYIEPAQMERLLELGLLALAPLDKSSPLMTQGISVLEVKDLPDGLTAQVDVAPEAFPREHQVIEVILESKDAQRLLSAFPGRGEDLVIRDPDDAQLDPRYGLPFYWVPKGVDSLSLGIWMNRILPAGKGISLELWQRDVPFAPTQQDAVAVLEDVGDGGAPLLRAATSAADYLFDKGSGALLALVDKSGKDWIGRDSLATEQGRLRGGPVLAPSSAPFLAGTAACETTVVEDSHLHAILDVQSKDGLWKMRWTIRPTVLLLEVLSAPEPYVLGLSGLPGGSLEPDQDGWMSSDGVGGKMSDAYSSEAGSPFSWLALTDGERDISLIAVLNARANMAAKASVVGEGVASSAQVAFSAAENGAKSAQPNIPAQPGKPAQPSTLALLLTGSKNGPYLNDRAKDVGNPPKLQVQLMDVNR